MTAFKWTIIAIWAIAGLLSIRDAAKHGQPRKPHDAGANAFAAALAVALIAWALAVLP